jgi:hypothetical protein
MEGCTNHSRGGAFSEGGYSTIVVSKIECYIDPIETWNRINT